MFKPVAGLVLLIIAIGTAQAADPRGRWLSASGNLEVELAECGRGLCGTVSKVIANRSMTPGRADLQAADNRSPLGLQVLTDFIAVEFDATTNLPKAWAGTVYNREADQHYPCRMTLDGVTLVLQAQIGPTLATTQRWTRVDLLTGAK